MQRFLLEQYLGDT